MSEADEAASPSIDDEYAPEDAGQDDGVADVHEASELDDQDVDFSDVGSQDANSLDSGDHDAGIQAAVEPLRWSPPEPTGVAMVDDAVALLASLDELSTSEHVAVYDAVHRQLQDSLADLDGH